MVVDIDKLSGGIIACEKSCARRIGIKDDHRVKSPGDDRSGGYPGLVRKKPVNLRNRVKVVGGHGLAHLFKGKHERKLGSQRVTVRTFMHRNKDRVAGLQGCYDRAGVTHRAACSDPSFLRSNAADP